MLSNNYQTLAKILSECGKALGDCGKMINKTLSDPSVQRFVAGVAVGSVTAAYVEQRDENKKLKAEMEKENEKNRLMQEALIKNDAIIKKLSDDADISNEKVEYLTELNEKLVRQIEICNNEDADE